MAIRLTGASPWKLVGFHVFKFFTASILCTRRATPRVENVVIAWLPIPSLAATNYFDPFAQMDPQSTAPYPRVPIPASITAIPYKDSEGHTFNALEDHSTFSR